MDLEPQRNIFIPMKPVYQQKIIERKKWTTLRSFPAAREIGLEVGSSAFITVLDQEFILTNLGAKTVDEAGGRDYIWNSEGFEKYGPSMPHVERWIEGYQRLFLYTIYMRDEWDQVRQYLQSSVNHNTQL